MTSPYPEPGRRRLIVISTVLASTMFAVDTTIANVALPHMQSSMSASQEQVIWVITSYMIASAIATPLASWLADRFGRKLLLLVSVGGFTLSSAACGLATDLTTAVIARAVQGITGAGMIPLGQAAVLDATPQEGHGRAMVVIGLGTMFAPLIGPTLGGWLTDAFSWRWVYFINLPIGAASFIIMALSMDESRSRRPMRFDMFGFVVLSLFLGCFQLMLDRGQHLDWFDSPEIWTYAVAMGLTFYMLGVHMFTARDTFVRPDIFADRNFALGCLISVVMGALTFATIPLTTVMMQHNLGYSALQTGLISSPRSVGTLIAMLAISPYVGKVDSRHFIAAGLAASAIGLYMLSQISPQVDTGHLLIAGLFQGFGSGLMFPPLSALVFATLPAAMRNEGAAMFTLTRSMGSSLGISFLQTATIQNTATVQSRLAEGVRPDNPVVQYGLPDFDFGSAGDIAGMTRGMIGQASMVGNVDSYWLVFLLALMALPIVVLMRPPKTEVTT